MRRENNFIGYKMSKKESKKPAEAVNHFDTTEYDDFIVGSEVSKKESKKILEVSNFIAMEYDKEFKKLLKSTADVDEQLVLIKQRMEYIDFLESVFVLSSRLNSLGELMQQQSGASPWYGQPPNSAPCRQYVSAKDACQTIRESILDMERFLGFKTT